jgi:hypothetical protein
MRPTNVLSVVVVFVACCVSTIDGRLWNSNDRNKNYRNRKLIQTDSEDGIASHYIVHFKDDVNDDEIEQRAKEAAIQSGGKILWVYKSIFKGFAISLVNSESRLATILDRDDVEVMEQVRIVQ